MSKKIRDWIFYLFIFFFVVGTVLISLYASGYKFNLSWPLKFNRLLIKTGIIAIDTMPRGAVVILNDEAQSNLSFNPFKTEYLTTAAKVKNVMPGEYDLRLELDGYWPFQKKIYVYSGQTTFAEDINLFRDDTPLLMATSSETGLGISASRKYLYIAALGKIINLKNGVERIVPASAAATWLKNSDLLLINGSIYGISPTEDIDYGRLIGDKADSWYLDEASDRLYYRNGSSLGYLKLSNKTSGLAVSGENYQAYEPRGDNLFFVVADSGRVALKKYSLASQKTEQELNLPAVGRYEFRRDGMKTLSLYDNQNKTLYLLDPDNITNSIQTIKNVVSWQWTDEDNLIYNNTWEIYSFNLKTGTSDLLTRVGEEIRELIWNGENDYLIFSTANSLNALDMKMNAATKIFQTDKLSGATLDMKDDILYFWARQGDAAGAYKMILQ